MTVHQNSYLFITLYIYLGKKRLWQYRGKPFSEIQLNSEQHTAQSALDGVGGVLTTAQELQIAAATLGMGLPLRLNLLTALAP